MVGVAVYVGVLAGGVVGVEVAVGFDVAVAVSTGGGEPTLIETARLTPNRCPSESAKRQ